MNFTIPSCLRLKNTFFVYHKSKSEPKETKTICSHGNLLSIIPFRVMAPPQKKKLKKQYNPSQTVLNSLLSFLYYLMSHQGSFKNGVVVV